MAFFWIRLIPRNLSDLQLMYYYSTFSFLLQKGGISGGNAGWLLHTAVLLDRNLSSARN
jgi:hypothetical protein